MDTLENRKIRFIRMATGFVLILSVYFGIKAFAELKSYSLIGAPSNISLSGHGEVTAAPDIATVYFTISKDASTIKAAQDMVTSVEGKVLSFLKDNKIDSKDIKTTNASFAPKYEYQNALCPATPLSGTEPVYCPNGRQVLTGYTASESITVKIRKIDDAGTIIQGLGSLGVSNLDGPNFSIDKEDALKAQARKAAIDDARTKAEALAKDLHVRLGKVVSFNEGTNYYPMAYDKGMTASMAVGAPAAPVLPQGENTISSDVTITYEIR